jgi:hypothetical protein
MRLVNVVARSARRSQEMRALPDQSDEASKQPMLRIASDFNTKWIVDPAGRSRIR